MNRLSSEQFFNEDGTASHWSVCTVGSDGLPKDVATGLMHDDKRQCDQELKELEAGSA